VHLGTTRDVQGLRREDGDEGEGRGLKILGHHPGEQRAGLVHETLSAASGDDGVV